MSNLFLLACKNVAKSCPEYAVLFVNRVFQTVLRDALVKTCPAIEKENFWHHYNVAVFKYMKENKESYVGEFGGRGIGVDVIFRLMLELRRPDYCVYTDQLFPRPSEKFLNSLKQNN